MTESITGMPQEEASASEALRKTAESTTREPAPTGRTPEGLAQWVRQAPLASLIAAFLAGYLMARRR